MISLEEKAIHDVKVFLDRSRSKFFCRMIIAFKSVDSIALLMQFTPINLYNMLFLRLQICSILKITFQYCICIFEYNLPLWREYNVNISIVPSTSAFSWECHLNPSSVLWPVHANISSHFAVHCSLSCYSAIVSYSLLVCALLSYFLCPVRPILSRTVSASVQAVHYLFSSSILLHLL